METVAVKIPASPQYVHVIRIMAAGLGSRLGFTIDDIDDLKIAVDEVAAYITGAQGRKGTLQINFHIHADRLEIAGTAHLQPGEQVRSELTAFSRQILDTIVDEAVLQQRDGSPVFLLTKKKIP
jgi:serine/threonine-protein kinase RsbW